MCVCECSSGSGPQAEPSPGQALPGLVPLTHQRVRESRARFLSVLRAQGLSNAEGRNGSQAVTPWFSGKGLSYFLTTLGLFLGYRPAHRPTAQVRYPSRVWLCVVNFREGNLSKMMVFSFLQFFCGGEERKTASRAAARGGLEERKSQLC